MSEIPFWVHDRPKWVSGITKSTTCQDVLHALVLAERKASTTATNKTSSTTSKKEAKEEELNAKEVSKGLALVEQWRGVERPLSNSSRILKLWLAWGEERSQVRFVVKRISQQPQQPQASSVSSATLRPQRSRPRRRNSRASATSDRPDKKAGDTLHPSALGKSSDQSTKSSSDLERLMRIILTQGETIHWQLKKLQEREGQIESIEQEVHQSRTKTAGKDYLLNAYLSHDKKKETLEATTEGLHEVLEALGKVIQLNDQITEAEEKANDLQSQLNVSSHSQSGSEMKSLQSDLKDLRTSNDQAGREIDENRHLISSMRLAYDERKALMAQLEKDVDSIELEGKRLQQELQALQVKSRQEQTFEILSRFTGSNDDLLEDDLDSHESPIIFSGGFLDDNGKVTGLTGMTGHYNTDIITSEQLYEGPQEPGALYDELQRRLQIKTSSMVGLDDLHLTSPDTSRIKATGSPGSNSSSGNSSGSGASYEKSVRFNDRQLILSTPELPDLPPVVSQNQQTNHLNPGRTKSILKPMESSNPTNATDNTDSNSDTGLSSLHSSSDEGTYVLDTLV